MKNLNNLLFIENAIKIYYFNLLLLLLNRVNLLNDLI